MQSMTLSVFLKQAHFTRIWVKFLITLFLKWNVYQQPPTRVNLFSLFYMVNIHIYCCFLLNMLPFLKIFTSFLSVFINPKMLLIKIQTLDYGNFSSFAVSLQTILKKKNK